MAIEVPLKSRAMSGVTRVTDTCGARWYASQAFVSSALLLGSPVLNQTEVPILLGRGSFDSLGGVLR